ncbi:MAG: beta-lactamase hydrolase domain-containing protein [Gemmatimonadaceae bacterium]
MKLAQRFLAVFVAATVVSMPAAGQHLTGPNPKGAIPTPVLMDTTGMFNSRFAKVGDDLFIAGQPTERGLRELKARGVTTVVNLRTAPEMARVGFDEAKLAAELGMTYVYLPVRGDSATPYSPATVDAFAAAMTSAKGKVLLHCTIAWRASHLWAAYLIKDRGVDVPAALANARAINLMDDMRMMTGRQPVEQFLDRDLPEIKRGAKAP